MSMVFGISGTRLKAALKQASAASAVECEQCEFVVVKVWSAHLGPDTDSKEPLVRIIDTIGDAYGPESTTGS